MHPVADQLFASFGTGAPEAKGGGAGAVAIRLPDGRQRVYGEGQPSGTLVVRDSRGLAALASRDELSTGEAYLDGALEVEGDFPAVLALRASFTDRHPLAKTLRFVRPLLRGQVAADHASVSPHYERDHDFWLSFLDRRHRCYSHGLFEHAEEALEDAVTRKLELALQSVNAQPGDRVLDVGGGWGAMTEFAGRRGVQVTSLTISLASRDFLRELIAGEALPCRVLLEHFYQHRSKEPYDAIVNLGVTEHLPDYPRTLRHYGTLLKPGGRIYLDAAASRVKDAVSTFTEKYIWRGNGSYLCLHDYVRAVAQSSFEAEMVVNDRASYALTATHWARNLEAARAQIEGRWGARLYRLFRLYLWSSAVAFETGGLQAYHMVLRRSETA